MITTYQEHMSTALLEAGGGGKLWGAIALERDIPGYEFSSDMGAH